MNEKPTPEEIERGLRIGYSFDPKTPGLQKVARDLLRPLVEKMDGQEIIYVCRVPKLMRVNYLETDDEGFRAVATPVHDLGCRIPTMAESAALQEAAKGSLTKKEWLAAVNALPLDTKPLEFGARRDFLHMHGDAISMNMITDHFYPDPAVVAEVKDAVMRNVLQEILPILERASGKR